MSYPSHLPPLSRRRFLGLAGAAAASVPVLSACGPGSAGGGGGGAGGSSEPLKFWDMTWSTPAYNEASKGIVTGWTPPEGVGQATYQTIQWANFNQTFSSAVASGTNPAVSTGGGFQAFRFANQDAIAYADDLIEKMKSDGLYDDFLPGSIDGMKTDEGHVAIPWHLDAHLWWYNKTLLDEAGASVPTNWDELLTTGKALKKIGAYGFATGAGAGNSLAYETPMAVMISNGGGLFDPEGNLDVMNERNVEAAQFIKQLLGEGIIDPASVAYTTDNMATQWKNKKFALGSDFAGLQDNLGGPVAKDLVVASPIAGPNGTGALVIQNNIMMYKKTPSQEGSESLTMNWLKNMKVFWDQKLIQGLPVLNSIIESPEFQARPNQVKAVKEYQPIGISYSARSKTVGVKQAQIDGAAPMVQFGQALLSDRTDATTDLTNLSNSLMPLVK